MMGCTPKGAWDRNAEMKAANAGNVVLVPSTSRSIPTDTCCWKWAARDFTSAAVFCPNVAAELFVEKMESQAFPPSDKPPKLTKTVGIFPRTGAVFLPVRAPKIRVGKNRRDTVYTWHY